MAAASEYVLEPIRDGSEFTLYRAQQRGNPMPLLVVAPTAEQPLPRSLRCLEHEFSLAAELEPAWAAKPLALTRHEGRTILVLTDPGGEPLDLLLGKPMELTQFLRTAIGVSAALRQMHGRGFVHKDIKPANILVNRTSEEARLTGFGIASRLPRERQAPVPPESIAGTLAYMAPEQTGRMNRSIDSRSDLYSLGVTLYKMLTGSLPFTASDPMEWVHCHIARKLVPPNERLEKIPVPVSDIIVKLLAKNAEERYQSAAGVERDLRRCLSEWEAQDRISDFSLGENDIPDRLMIPEKLYGRDREVHTLLAAFDRIVAGGRPELVLVSGYSGIGKSAVVNELHKPLVPPRGLFASGKFDQYKRDIPYATLAQAFQGLIRPLLSKSEEELRKWRDALHEALDPNGLLIVELVPELKHIIGEQPPVPELPPKDAQGRFQLIFRRFISVFARPESPLALFLDDLQWLDAATLDLLEDLLSRTDMKHLLLIGAYRDNEVNSTHPLMRKLDAMRQAGSVLQDIVLAPLGREDLRQLLADSLRCERNRAAPLAQLIHEKTSGNPFFAIQFILTLAEEGLLNFDYDEAQWSWDLNRIHAKGYTDNVVDLMVGKLSRLPIDTQKALQQFACMGNSAEFEMLQIVYEDAIERMHDQLWEAVRAGLIFRSENSYRFLHDRVQEAAYSLIPKELRAEAHLRIGRLLAENTPPEKLEDIIFEIVNQLNRGSHLINSVEERERVAGLNLIAGRRAKISTAYASALKYLIAGAELLGDDAWASRRDLIFVLELERAGCEFLIGELAAADKRLTALPNHATNNVERAAVACLHIDVCTTLDQSGRAIAVALEFLRHVGIEWSPHPTEQEARREYERTWSLLRDREIEELLDLPLMSDPSYAGTLDVLERSLKTALYTDANLLTLLVCGMANISLEHGHAEASCDGYIWLGMIAGSKFGDYKAGFRFGQLGYDLVERRGLERFKAHTYLSFAVLIIPWTKHVRIAEELFQRAFDAANATGDLTTAASCGVDVFGNLMTRGDPLPEVQRKAEQSLEFARNARFGLLADIGATQLALIRTLRGLTPVFGCFKDAQFDELQVERRLSNQEGHAIAACWHWVRKLQACFFAGDYAAAVAASSNAQRLLWTSPSFLEIADAHFYGALSRAASCDAAFPVQYRQHVEALTAHHKQIAEWAEHCPENFENRAALVAAEIARIEGRVIEAEELYEKAIGSAQKYAFIHNEAIANELAAQFYRTRGFGTIADAYLRNARHCYLRWGADGKVQQLDRLYPHLAAPEGQRPAAIIGSAVQHLDVASVVKASQALSSEMVLPKLVERLMRIAMEHAGAERGLLILIQDGEPRIEAEANTGTGKIEVVVCEGQVTPSDLPQSALHYVIRTQESVLLDDASADNLYSKDEYIEQKRSRSVLCLPIVIQGKLVGALYLENNLTPGVFTPDRVTVLQLLASQAAISLENATLYSDLQLQAGLLQRLPVSAWTLKPDGTPDFVNQVWLEFAGQTLDFVRSYPEAWMTAVHPVDREAASKVLWDGVRSGKGFAFESRSLCAKDGTYRWHLQQAVVLRDAEGKVAKFVGTTTDIDDQKRAEEKIRQSEKEARQLLDLSPMHITEFGPDGARLYTNRASLDYYGITLEEWQDADLRKVLHPQDADLVSGDLRGKLQTGSPFEYEARLKRKDGKYRWFHYRLSPMTDEQGHITRWYAAGTDIDDRKLAEQRLQEENVALREEIDKASMFEEIVGTSAALKKVLARISKVAPTESSVLITGETGTGKELVARAIHRRSRRSSHAFVSVNCAAIPHDLIASELFGHEKGSFTGATQRRLGRFELAEKGTIFLDEVGELPGETQVALLRVLQEREFERVGGTDSIRSDVRVIAATNRDLESAIESGKFRRDLFYRLNVFPVELPPLRKRSEDIPLLISYFLNRYARKAGRHFTAVDKKSLDLLQSYAWPGNIRELQNVIERSVIVSESQTFSVDESWLSRRSSAGNVDVEPNLFYRSPAQEKAVIEAALRECGGRVYGSSGAAAKLGIPRTTLESKIKSLKINKNRFKGPDPLKDR